MRRFVPVAAVLALMVQVTGTAHAAGTSATTDFENGQVAPYFVCTTQSPNYGIVEQAHGTRAMEFFWTAQGYDGTRMDRGAEACSDVESFKEGWMGFRLLVPSTAYPQDKTTIVAQIFSNGGCSSWSGTLMIKNNELWIEHRAGCGSANGLVRLTTALPRDTWLPITLHYVVSKQQAGLVEAWYGGATKSQPTYRAAGIDFGGIGQFAAGTDELARTAGNHIGLKFGMYCSDTAGYTPNETRTLYYDDVTQLAGNPPGAFEQVHPG